MAFTLFSSSFGFVPEEQENSIEMMAKLSAGVKICFILWRF
jgi:hypothetical protein